MKTDLFLSHKQMSIYFVPSPFNNTDGIIVSCSVWNKIVQQYTDEHCWTDVLYLYEHKKAIYNLAYQRKQYALSQFDYRHMTDSQRPSMGSYYWTNL